jgi:hypothetical protein
MLMRISASLIVSRKSQIFGAIFEESRICWVRSIASLSISCLSSSVSLYTAILDFVRESNIGRIDGFVFRDTLSAGFYQHDLKL